MSDLYCVFGNPVSHSKSPSIHTAFAAQCRQDLRYEALLAPIDAFAASVRAFVAAGGRGANVTVPFKEEAFRLATRLTVRAELAVAVNSLRFDGAEILGDNTDGAGLLKDLTKNLEFAIAGQRVLLLGAGGAARGVVASLLEERPAVLVIANRNTVRAQELAQRFAAIATAARPRGCGYLELAGQSFDLVINATSASLAGALPPLPVAPSVFAPASLAYDMMYGKGETPFLAFARAQGAERLADGVGMLVEQAAEAFHFWRGVCPDTAPVIAALRTLAPAG
ncbi:MAG: Shikimate dehydrogenase [Candidatus Accumulibacter appositus]|uniref:Shikimate dehydrogenase (NADP(+)) n=1 Tax=Candidatus Accumulibacter appositus TaxID=1454003 RepID=A0A011NUL5_9PROT|nr:shikimate dehydrogenase [Accumulibacter sp.]EXI79021.1 MAG: Shikimate dehydrogenase [Candidatus Accumulibacter appositus]HRF03223.1 shikimate dehydrogenase [Accumulibacter sp.]